MQKWFIGNEKFIKCKNSVVSPALSNASTILPQHTQWAKKAAKSELLLIAKENDEQHESGCDQAAKDQAEIAKIGPPLPLAFFLASAHDIFELFQVELDVRLAGVHRSQWHWLHSGLTVQNCSRTSLRTFGSGVTVNWLSAAHSWFFYAPTLVQN